MPFRLSGKQSLRPKNRTSRNCGQKGGFRNFEVENNLKKTNVDYTKITDREKAVRFAVEKAGKGDVVFLAGKGHEHTQIVGNSTVYYKGDMDTAKEALEEK